MSGSGYFNDLWRFGTTTNQWTWINGTATADQPGVYGTRGTPSSANHPGGRSGAVAWRDRSGAFWLFGGFGRDGAGNSGFLNDLWRYNPPVNQWTWIGGAATINQPGVYGTLGIANPANSPGARAGAVSWVDASGALWLFGGWGYYMAGNTGNLNDLWKYDSSTSQWTWVKGAKTANQSGIYGQQGIPAPSNVPGAREETVSWTDGSGRLWLFGGWRRDNLLLNDLWRYDPPTNQWTWMKGSSTWDQIGVYGTKGTANAANTPGARRQPVSWTDASGALWLLGGAGFGSVGGAGGLSDLWKYDPATDKWTWMKGPNTVNQSGVFGTQGVPDTANNPPGRRSMAAWRDGSGYLWFYGGDGQGNPYYPKQTYNNDLWKYNPGTNQWTWVRGNAAGTLRGYYGVQGRPGSQNLPGNRQEACSWANLKGSLWLFGGHGVDSRGESGFLNDLWRYDPAEKTWTWVRGCPYVNQPGVYWPQGSVENTPGARRQPVSWTDGSGRLWLFGGYGRDHLGNEGLLNDLWRFDPGTSLWIWVTGSMDLNQPGVYGQQGVPDIDNTPGTRRNAVSWTDRGGDLWLFGGFGYSEPGIQAFLNDLWRFNTATEEWTWVNGASTCDQSGVYGTPGARAPANTPGARECAVSWADLSGNLWLFGGRGYDRRGQRSYLNDLWKHDPATNQWAWMKGSDITNQRGMYGTQGLPGNDTTPGARQEAVSWTGQTGDLWLFGGYGHDSTGFYSYLNDLWRYEPASNQWTWIKGASIADEWGYCQSAGIPSLRNTPGACYGAVSWREPQSRTLWLLGGKGYNPGGFLTELGNLWRLTPGATAARSWTLY
jgi:N-acetylneuraminic acid mutarotase